MKHLVFYICFLFSLNFFSQNVQVDSQTYSPQQLIEDILINSSCITNVNVTNVIGGNFNGTDQSYGYFNANGSSFPFQSGVVLSTGKLSNVQGPNTSLSDDNALNWGGDADLEAILNENNTTNATIIEFDFTSEASQISFRYIFASEEYQINNANTCKYSDLFGFLIKKVGDTQYANIALIPNTQTPVKVTTVHPDIPNGCQEQNQTYFGSWNNSTAPINFNGQTSILTATANTIPNETYHVKLVIADEQNYRYDSAVFLEAGSFNFSTDLGADRLIATNNPLCDNETLVLDAFQTNATSYKWSKNGIEIIGETNNTYTVVDAGTYNVEVTLQGSCISYGEINIEYASSLQTTPCFLDFCDNDTDGITFFDLHVVDPYFTLPGNPLLQVVNYFLTANDAAQNINPIPNPNSFINTTPMQVVFARLENDYGCFAVETLTLRANYTNSSITTFDACDDDGDGYTSFNLNELRLQIQPEVSQNVPITFYSTYSDAANHTNQLSDSYINTSAFTQDIYVKAKDVFCELFTSITLNVNTPPQLLPEEEILYCLNSYPQTITLSSGLLNGTGNNPTYQWFLNNVALAATSESISINETGIYTVLVTFSNTCSASRNIIVTASEKATITQNDVSVVELSENNSVTINTSNLGNGTYEFALREVGSSFINYQSEPVFNNVKPGFYTIYIQNSICGITTIDISVIGHSKYFTPNNDGFNDYWQIKGLNTNNQPNSIIFIYDRYGKLIKQLAANSIGWDGTFNGKILPTDDYWFKVILEDGRVYSGHFTLKR